MDWKKIERDVKIQTGNLTSNRSHHHHLPPPPPQQSSSSLYSQFDQSLSTYALELGASNSHGNNLSNGQISNNLDHNHLQYHHDYLLQPSTTSSTTSLAIISSMNEFKETIAQQNNKISYLTQQLDHMTTIITTTSLNNNAQNKYDDTYLLQRLTKLESDQQNNFKSITNLTKEHNEYLIQTKNITNKMDWLEEMIRTISHDYISKLSFSQFLETCTEQLKLIQLTTDTAQKNTSLCMSFLDSFLVALSQLQHISSPSLSSSNGSNTTSGGFVMGLEYLTSLGSSSGGRERQSTQITNLLRSALLTTISREVECCTGSIHNLAISSAEEMRKELAMAMEEIKEEVLRHGQGIGDEVMKASENTAHSIAELSKQIDRVRRKLDGESATLREGQQVVELEIAEIRQAMKKTDESCSKLVSITIPATQRNHKALLDEVLRIEETNSQIVTRVDVTEKSFKKLESQCLSLQTSQTNLIKLIEREREEREREGQYIEKERHEERKREVVDVPRLREKNEDITTISNDSPPLTCSECKNLKNQLIQLEEKTNRLGNSMKTLDEGVNSLHTEFAMIYETIEEKKRTEANSDQGERNVDYNDLLTRITSIEKEIPSLKRGVKDQIGELQMKIEEEKRRREENEKTGGDKEKNLEMRIQERFHRELEGVQKKVEEVLNETKLQKHIPEIPIPVEKYQERSLIRSEILKKDTLEDQRTREKEIAESEQKILQRNKLLHEEEDEEDDEEEEDDEGEENDAKGGANEKEEEQEDEQQEQEEDDNDPQESSFLESDEEEVTPPLVQRRNVMNPPTEEFEDDNLSVNSSSSSSSSQHSMKETSRIGDSLDESIEILESMRQQQQQQQKKPTSLLSYEVDSLGNMIPINRSNSNTTIGTKEISTNTISNNTTTSSISSGSLLGSGGRNKAVPISSKPSIPPPSSTLPPFPDTVPLPSANIATSRQHQESSAQCTFCLRRFNIDELKNHLKICELRTELCKYGCRSRIMASKMDKHIEICPNNPNNRE